MDIKKDNNFLLITAAHNEADLIEGTIKSVLNQENKPTEWIIIDDGSTDKTSEIALKYKNVNTFIKVYRKYDDSMRNFSSKVAAINFGLSKTSINNYEYIGIIDADITLNPTYYKLAISKFDADPKLGIVGGMIYDIVNGKVKPLNLHPNITRGAIQLFRRTCFEEIGGFLPIKYGGEDAAACISARLKGWKVINFEELEGFHHRPTGTADRGILSARFRDGFVEYHLGYHPIFQFAKCLSRIKEYPILIGSVLRFLGFWTATIKKEPRIISNTQKIFTQKEQIKRLFQFKLKNFNL